MSAAVLCPIPPRAPRRRAARALAGAVTAVGLLIPAGPGAPAARADAGAGSCREVAVRGNAGPGLAHVRTAGTLCVPSTVTPRRRTLQLLVHGGSYNRSYWDFALQPERYSYVRAALAAGYSTLAIDKLGAGASTMPLSALVTNDAQAAALHNVVTSVRSGRWGPFSRVVLVGHSMGTAVVVTEAGRYADVDGVVATGLLHHVGQGLVPLFTSLGPAFLDPRLGARNPDPGYVTTRPGTRGAAFYHGPGADPRVIAHDEATKDQAALTDVAGTALEFGAGALASRGRDITVPVLVAVGDHDGVGCGLGLRCASAAAVDANERRIFSATPELRTVVMADTGHDLNLHRSAPAFFGAVMDWVAGVAQRPAS